MPLTHVCVWDGKAGYRRVSIEEACSMYPYTVAANSEIFVCSLCAQSVGLSAHRLWTFRGCAEAPASGR